jgi:hypothetical protein
MEQIETAEWRLMNKRNHANWVYEQEAKGTQIHKSTFQFGPKHPESYLLYNDSGTLVFPRDHAGLYSSYAFWLNHLCDKEPIEYLGILYFSSRELGVSPDLIEEFYGLQNEFIEYGYGNTERMNDIQTQLQAGLHKIEGMQAHK